MNKLLYILLLAFPLFFGTIATDAYYVENESNSTDEQSIIELFSDEAGIETLFKEPSSHVLTVVDNSFNFCVSRISKTQVRSKNRIISVYKSLLPHSNDLKKSNNIINGVSRFDLSAGSLKSEHILCFVYLFCRIII